MLGGLQLPSDPRWVYLAEKEIDEILSDHAYCEQKAASTCIAIIQRFPEFNNVVDALIPIVSEEWGHFKMVKDIIDNRGLKLGKQRKDEYVIKLHKHIIKGRSRTLQVSERLFVSALVEARSCERFRILSTVLKDEKLKNFYKKLMISEAGHFRLFLDLASNLLPNDLFEKRWKEWLITEANIIKSIEVRGDRVH